MPGPLAKQLADLTLRRAPAAAAAWFAPQAASLQSSVASRRAAFLSAFSSAGRLLGPAPQTLGPGALGHGGEAFLILLSGRGLDELGRVALLLAEVDAAADGHEELVHELFFRGDVREKQAVLRALPLLPGPARFLEVGVEACRSSVQTIFEAIACENPYPADHFSEAAFNQLVLKALFIETSVLRIAGLERRAAAELLRMAEGYGNERRAAGRSVPEDIDRIAALVRRA